MPLLSLPLSFDTDLAYYIAGPMSGIEEYNYPTFERAMMEFRELKAHVYSPHEPYYKMTQEEHSKNSYEWYVKVSLRLLLRADGIILLPGWTQSRGARREADIAMDLKYPVWFYDFETLINMDLEK